ncbi:MAG: MMPL family transporter [Desulfobacter sp.]|nr:MMPL family transporter [Desulfobacter sp.]
MIPASWVSIDGSGVSFLVDDSERHKDYLAFVDSFGTDDYLILAIENSLKISDPQLQKRMNKIHHQLMDMDSVLKVIDLGSIASSNLIKIVRRSDFWNETELARVRQIIPGVGRLVSHDMKTLAVIIKINNENLNGFQLEKQLDQMKQILIEEFPEHPHCYASGIPVLRAAFERYNFQSALAFGCIGLLFGTLIAFYLFRTLWAAVMVFLTSLVSLLWMLGFMGVLGIDLNLATGLSFGFILVVSTTTVFHIVSAYLQQLKTESKHRALLNAFQTVLSPCFMCALTTSAGFLSLTISPVPMVCQAGIIISIGVMLAFCLTLVITALLLPVLLTSCPQKNLNASPRLLKRLINTYMIIGFRNPKRCAGLGMAFILVMSWAIPEIQTVKHLTHAAIKNTQEAKDLDYIEQQISTTTSFSVILEPNASMLQTKRFWYDLIQYEKEINTIQGVKAVESITPLIFRMALKFFIGEIRPEKIFDQLLAQSHKNDDLEAYYNSKTKKIRIIVHIQNRTSDQIETILRRVDKQTKHTFAGKAGISLSGQMLLLRSQTTDLVSSQIKTLGVALFVITILMMIQFKSIVIGALSLIPNMFPLVSIFGIMGWCHIPLDPLTIFAAVISFGLSVDDSIHYLAQLNKEIRLAKPKVKIHTCLKTAYHKTVRSLVSTTAVLFFAALGLLFSSFSHVFSLGILISCASIIALAGDLIFMPAAILTFKPLNHFLSGKLKEPTS